ncbi:MAG TPA: hypothetical protein VIJ25_20645, partial [Methylococcales bacterium]
MTQQAELTETAPTAQAIEQDIRTSIRDAVNRNSRKPFTWGGLAGYRQLEAIAMALHELPLTQQGMEYFQQLVTQVDVALARNRARAEDLSSAQEQLIEIAQCLGYPTPHDSPTGTVFVKERRRYTDPNLTSTTIRKEMEVLLKKNQSISGQYLAQTALSIGFRRRWKSFGSSLLHCYDIPGLPPDNLKLESVFGKLRNHARRITGRKSTRELRDFGQCQILFLAESPEDLLEQMQQVPLSTYQAQRESLEKAEAPQRFIRQLHRDTLKATRKLLSKYPNL